MGKALKLLIIEDRVADFMLLERHLQRQGLEAACVLVSDRKELEAALEAGGWDAVLSDYHVDGLDFRLGFDLVRTRYPELPVILVSGSLREDEAVEWLKQGVADFVLKDRLARLVPAIERALREAEERSSRQATEEALRRSREMLRLITDAAPALISYVDSDYCYRLVNRCYERWFGLRPEELVGRSAREVLGEAAWEVVHSYVDRALAGEEVSYEQELPYQGAGPRWVQVYYTPDRGADGRVRGFVVLVQDVEARKQVELALEAHKVHLEDEVAARTAQLAATNRELQAFAYAVSHDLKAPLRSINAFSGLLESRCRDRLEGDCLQFLGFIQQGVGRMNSLIDDLLDYARMEQRTLQATVLELPAVVLATLDEKEEEIRRLGAQVRADLPPLKVKADPEGLAQVLRNLVDNALKFSAQATPPVIEIGARVAEGGYCQLWIRDNGIGFDMAQYERIFEIFQRLHSIEEFPGTGIGLALIKKAMERMGGRVWAESTPGRGATFYLELPD
ncbi:MAG TPA: ATP-binding protein [Rhodocyclaceae bacterium]|nr:ATP-binding protein [Rhodocyclaceae bacterium]